MRKPELEVLISVLHDLQWRVFKLQGSIDNLAEIIAEDGDSSAEEAGVSVPRGTDDARQPDSTPPYFQPRCGGHQDQTVLEWRTAKMPPVPATPPVPPSPSTEVESLESLVIEAHEDRRLRSEPGESRG
jgi:hypothetical protein